MNTPAMYDLDQLYAERTRQIQDIRDLEQTYKAARKTMSDRLAETNRLIEGAKDVIRAHQEAI